MRVMNTEGKIKGKIFSADKNEEVSLVEVVKNEMWYKPTAQACALDLRRRQEEFAKVPKHVLEMLKREWGVDYTISKDRHVDVVSGREVHEEPVDGTSNIKDKAYMTSEQVMASKVANDKLDYRPSDYDKAVIDGNFEKLKRSVKEAKKGDTQGLFVNLEKYIRKGMDMLPAVQRCMKDWEHSNKGRLIEDKSKQEPTVAGTGFRILKSL